MTAPDSNDLIPAPQEKLEWVTPKISLMESDATEGRFEIFTNAAEHHFFFPATSQKGFHSKAIDNHARQKIFIMWPIIGFYFSTSAALSALTAA